MMGQHIRTEPMSCYFRLEDQIPELARNANGASPARQRDPDGAAGWVCRTPPHRRRAVESARRHPERPNAPDVSLARSDGCGGQI